MKEANTLRLKALILAELEQIHSTTAVPTKLEFTASNSVNVDIKQFELELSIQKVYKDFKDYKFWLQQAQVRKLNEDDWESPLDYLASGLRELPLNL
jgi:hypothetical protein